MAAKGKDFECTFIYIPVINQLYIIEHTIKYDHNCIFIPSCFEMITRYIEQTFHI
jgi:hypothetical protein